MPIYKSDLIQSGFSADPRGFSAEIMAAYFFFPPIEKVDTFKMEIPFVYKDHDDAEYIATAYVREVDGKFYFTAVDPVDGDGCSWAGMWRGGIIEYPDPCEMVKSVEFIQKRIAEIRKGYKVKQCANSPIRFVYVIKSDHGYKIGITHLPEKRSRLIGTHLPFKSNVIRLYPTKKQTTREIEKWIHGYFKQKRLNGEWFALDDIDIAKIDALMLLSDSVYNPGIIDDKEGEKPSPMDFSAAVEMGEWAASLKKSLTQIIIERKSFSDFASDN
jgi:hypothetical protein